VGVDLVSYRIIFGDNVFDLQARDEARRQSVLALLR
jgi:hypothetical protein